MGVGKSLLLRLAGALLVGGACIAARLALHAAAARPGAAPALLLGAASFLALSLGAALLSLGHHILDEIEVSARWHRRS